jgi:hypothetical protein
MGGNRSTLMNRFRTNATRIFGPGFDEASFSSKFKRINIPKLQELLSASPLMKGNR